MRRRVPLPAELKGRLNYAPQSLRIDGLQLSLAQQQLSGQIKAQGGNPWRIDAQLASPSIDLARWLPPRPARRRPGAAYRPTPLRQHAAGAGRAGRLARRRWRCAWTPLLVPGLPPLSQLNLQLDAQPGRLKLDPLSAGMADGTLRGSLSVSHGRQRSRRAWRCSFRRTSCRWMRLLKASGHSAYASGGQLQLRADLAGAGQRRSSSPPAPAAS